MKLLGLERVAISHMLVSESNVRNVTVTSSS